MSGMAGLLYQGATAECGPALTRMSESIAHRGGRTRSHLEHDRLGIVTRWHEGGGHVTSLFVGPDGLAVFDGLLAGVDELARLAGLDARAEPAEVLWRLLERQGPSALALLDGVFALLVYRRPEHRVLLARDRFGHRQLHYAVADGHFWWATEIKAILADGRFTPRVNDEQVIPITASGMTLGPETMFRRVYKLVPGHYAHGTPGELLRLERFYNPPRPTTVDWSQEECDRRLAELVERGVRRIYQACPNQAVLLSTGVDSALVAGFLADVSGRSASALSAGADWPGDETADAGRIAEQCGLRFHRMVIPNDEDMLDHLRRLVWQVEQPTRFDNTWALQAALARAGDQPLGLMTGEGADSILGCGEMLRSHRRQRLANLPRPVQWTLEGMAPLLRRVPKVRVWADLLRLPGIEAVIRDGLAVPLGPHDRPTPWPVPEFLRKLDEHMVGWPGENQMQVLETLSYLTPWVERLDAMASGIGREAFAPILSNDVLELALSLPMAHKHDGRHAKPCLRRLAARRFGPEMAWCPKRQISSPTAIWLRRCPSVRSGVEALGRPDSRIRQFLPGPVIDGYLRRLADSDAQDGPARWTTFRMLSLELWLDLFFGDGSRAPQPHPDQARRPHGYQQTLAA